MVRSGHAYTEGFALHGFSPQLYCLKDALSILFWSLFLPLLVFFLIGLTYGWSLLLLTLYLVQAWRIKRAKVAEGNLSSESTLYALLTIIGKFAQFFGMVTFAKNRLLKRSTKLMEYKLSKSDSLAATKG